MTGFIISDPLYRAGFVQNVQNASISQPYGKNAIHSIANIPQMSNGSSAYYNLHQVQSSHPNSQSYFSHVPGRNNSNPRYGSKAHHQQQQHEVNQI